MLSGDPVDLIETVAERIAATVLSHAIVQAVDVSVHKPQAPIEVPFGDVVVRIRRDRAEAARRRAVPAADARATPPAAGAPRPDPDRVVPGDPGARCTGGRRGRRRGCRRPPPPVDAPPPAVAARRSRSSRRPSRGRRSCRRSGSGLPPAPGELSQRGPRRCPRLRRAHAGSSRPVAPPRTPTCPDPTVATAAVGTIGTDWSRRAPDAVVGEIVTDSLDVTPPTVVDVVLALGANLGAAQDTLRAAVDVLSHTTGPRGRPGVAARPDGRRSADRSSPTTSTRSSWRARCSRRASCCA